MLPGGIYHIYNHANGWENLFIEEKNYPFFLKKLSIHVLPICDIFAWCLMPNHFHLLARIKEQAALAEYFHKRNSLKQFSKKNYMLESEVLEMEAPSLVEWNTIKKISKSFSNLFSSYTQSFNKIYDRLGGLFVPNMKSKEVISQDAFCNVVKYIHNNPVHHNFVKRMGDWPHSSYNKIINNKPGFVDRKYLLNQFGGIEEFIRFHNS